MSEPRKKRTRGGEIRFGDEEVRRGNAVDSRVFDFVEGNAGVFEEKGEADDAVEGGARGLERGEKGRFVGAVEKRDYRGTAVNRGKERNPRQRVM